MDNLEKKNLENLNILLYYLENSLEKEFANKNNNPYFRDNCKNLLKSSFDFRTKLVCFINNPFYEDFLKDKEVKDGAELQKDLEQEEEEMELIDLIKEEE